MWPKLGFLPQIAQTFDIGRASVAEAGAYPAAAVRSCEKRSAISSAARTASAPLRDARLGLLSRVAREHAERDGDPGLQPRELEAAGRFGRDVVEVRRLAPDDAAECDHAEVPTRLRERHRSDRQLERSWYRDNRQLRARDADRVELGERRLEQFRRDVPVELRHDDGDEPARRPGFALEHVHVVGDLDVAGGVLARFLLELGLLGRNRLELRLRLGLRLRLLLRLGCRHGLRLGLRRKDVLGGAVGPALRRLLRHASSRSSRMP